VVWNSHRFPLAFLPSFIDLQKGALMARSATVLVVLVAFSTFTGATLAQTASKPDGLWRGAIGAGMSATSGNTDSTNFNVSADAVRETNYDKLNGYLQALYGTRENGGATEKTSELIRAGGGYNRDTNHRYFGFGTLDFERNGLIDLDLRSVFAGGIGYHIIRSERLNFDISTGPAYNREQYKTLTRDALEWLFAEESTHTLNPAVSFRQRLTYYPSLRESGEYRVVFDGGFVFKITERWNATMTLNDRYQSNPLVGVKKNDVLFVTGLQYAFNP
jgi:putative salt-induced outer membrane protein YdiY